MTWKALWPKPREGGIGAKIPNPKRWLDSKGNELGLMSSPKRGSDRHCPQPGDGCGHLYPN